MASEVKEFSVPKVNEINSLNKVEEKLFVDVFEDKIQQ